MKLSLLLSLKHFMTAVMMLCGAAAEDKFSLFSWENVSSSTEDTWQPLAPPIRFNEEGIDIYQWWDSSDDGFTIAVAEVHDKYPSVYELEHRVSDDSAEVPPAPVEAVSRSFSLNNNGGNMDTNSTFDYKYFWKHTLVNSSDAPMNVNDVDRNDTRIDSSEFWHCGISGGGTHFITSKEDLQGLNIKEYVVYYNNETIGWTQLFIAPKFYEHHGKLSSTGTYREEVTRPLINDDGSRLSMPVSLTKKISAQGEEDEWQHQNEYGVRVHEWNGTDYVQMGQTILDPNNRRGTIQVDRSGNTIVAFGHEYNFNVTTGLWEPVRPSDLPWWHLLSRDGSRMLRRSTSPFKSTLDIFQQKSDKSWDKIAEVPGTSGSTVAFDGSGKTVVVSGTNSSHVIVFQEDECSRANPDDAEDVSCTFVVVGRLPCRHCMRVAISSDGKRVLTSYNEWGPTDDDVSMAQYNGSSTLISFERPNGPQPKEGSDTLQEDTKNAPSSSSPRGQWVLPALFILVTSAFA